MTLTFQLCVSRNRCLVPFLSIWATNMVPELHITRCAGTSVNFEACDEAYDGRVLSEVFEPHCLYIGCTIASIRRTIAAVIGFQALGTLAGYLAGTEPSERYTLLFRYLALAMFTLGRHAQCR